MSAFESQLRQSLTNLLDPSSRLSWECWEGRRRVAGANFHR